MNYKDYNVFNYYEYDNKGPKKKIHKNTNNNVKNVKITNKSIKNVSKRKQLNSSTRQVCWLNNVGPYYSSKCLCCYTRDMTVFNFHAAHIIAACKGGSDTVDNLIPTCANCNLSMGDTEFKEFQRKCGFIKPVFFYFYNIFKLR